MELATYAAQADLLRILLKSDASDYLRQRIYQHFSDIFDDWMSAASNETWKLYVSDNDYELYKRFSFAGNYKIICMWVIDGCKTPIDDLVHFFVKIYSNNSQFITISQNT